MYFFGHGSQHEFKLLFGADSLRTLVAQMFQSGGDVDLTGAFGHAMQHHVDQAVRSSATGTITWSIEIKKKKKKTEKKKKNFKFYMQM